MFYLDWYSYSRIRASLLFHTDFISFDLLKTAYDTDPYPLKKHVLKRSDFSDFFLKFSRSHHCKNCRQNVITDALCIVHHQHYLKLKLYFWENYLKVLPIQIIQQIQNEFLQIVDIAPWAGQFQIEMEHFHSETAALPGISSRICFALDTVLMLNVLSHLKNQRTVNSSHILLTMLLTTRVYSPNEDHKYSI